MLLMAVRTTIKFFISKNYSQICTFPVLQSVTFRCSVRSGNRAFLTDAIGFTTALQIDLGQAQLEKISVA